MSIIRDASLSAEGIKKIDWVRGYMPILDEIEKEFSVTKPFSGVRIAMSIHLEAKTARFAHMLKMAGAEVFASGCNSLSTKDDVCAGLDSLGIEVNAVHGCSDREYYDHLKTTLSHKPDVIVDDGGDFIKLLHEECPEYGANLIGGCEETTTGINRLKAMERAGILRYPMIDVNDANSKHLFDNRYGTIRYGRDNERDERFDSGEESRRCGIRMVRKRDRDARKRNGRTRYRYRGRRIQGSRSINGRFYGHENVGSSGAGRYFRNGDGM